ncbi:MAG: CoA pyrophosphatase [Deltaproteobacteria bacterium]|nr:MAG: CoA pyrophosphatase [Deltaproteobacteria bacterium]
MDLPERLGRFLRERKRTALSEPDAVECAVLVPIVREPSGHAVVYTLRSEELPSHKGQVSFPGGKRAPGDRTLLDTALREAGEEIGIDPADVTILGQLDDVFTMVTDYIITPFVGLLPDGVRFTPNPSEVSDLFTVSIEDLLDPRYHEIATKNFRGHEIDIEVITAGRHTIWGATHRITANLIECLRELRAGAMDRS